MPSPLVPVIRSVLVVFIAKGKYGQFLANRYLTDRPLTTWRTDDKDRGRG
jgi:hypothetical protein